MSVRPPVMLPAWGTPPAPPSAHVARPRLDRHLDATRRTPATLLHAPAGYGKTTLLADWYRMTVDTGEAAVWISAREAGSLFASIMSALQIAGPRPYAPVPRRDPAGLTTQIARAMDDSTGSLAIFLDDLVLGDRAHADAFAIMVQDLPRRCRLIATARQRPNIALARLRAAERFAEVPASEIAFNASEMAQLLERHEIRGLRTVDVESFNVRPRSWVGGARLAIAGCPRSPARLEDLSISGDRGFIADFFVEEVAGRLGDETRRFLRQVSVLASLSADLCDTATERDDSGSRLAEAEGIGAFVERTDVNRGLYALHPLFREFLRHELEAHEPEAAVEIAGRGSAALEAAGNAAEALQVAVGVEDWARAVDVLNACCPNVTYQGRVHQLADSMRRLPRDALRQFPQILLTTAWAMSTQHDFVAAHELLGFVAEHLNDLTDDDTDRERLRYLLDHGEMVIAQFTDDQPEVERKCLGLLARPVEIEPYIVASVESSLLYAQREQFNLRNLASLDSSALLQYRRADSAYGFVWHQLIVGPSRCMAGDSAGAVRALREALDAARAFGTGQDWVLAGPACLLAEVLYERNELDEARALLEEHRRHIKHGFVDHMIAGHVTWARLLAAGSRTGEALSVLADCTTFAKNRGIGRLRDIVVAERVRLLLQTGHSTEAFQLARTEGFAVDPQVLLPVAGATTATEARAFVWTRIAKAEGRIADALRLAKRWAVFTTGNGIIRSAVRWNILLGQLRLLDGDERAARRQVRQAAAAAAPGWFLRAFLDEGDAAVMLLADPGSLSEPQAAATTTDAFARAVLEAAHPDAQRHSHSEGDGEAVIVSPLTPRESEIAALVAAGMRNREIGQRLGMTEGSVKWHLQQVYDKVGIRRRAGAIRRIRELGLIP